MNNIKDDRALTETPAHYPLLGAWPSSQPDSGSCGWEGSGLGVGGEKRRGLALCMGWTWQSGPRLGGQESCLGACTGQSLFLSLASGFPSE